ncbi:MAG: TrmB family transcriptional regulator [Halobacteriota archaeon]
MSNANDFTTHLMGFGLTEKEAHCYYYLLKYGPKTPSALAKSLKTYRKDIHRTLASLVDKGIVRPSLDSQTLYSAVELNTVLVSALKKHEAELQELEARKLELEELSRQEQFRPLNEAAKPPHEVVTYQIVKTLKEYLTLVMPLITSLENELLMVINDAIVVVASQFGVIPFAQEFIERGGKARSIFDLTYPIIGITRELLDAGIEVRHSDQLGILFAVFDRRVSISNINAGLTRFSLDEPLTALYTDDRTYAHDLTSTFELLWEQATPVEERMQELLKHGPPKS